MRRLRRDGVCWKRYAPTRLEKLTEDGEYPGAVRRHAEYFRDLISPIAVSSKAWLSRDDVAPCAREIDNVRAALDWAFSPDGDAEIGARLTVAFAPIWQMLSLMGECRDRVERMLATRPPDVDLGQAAEWRMWIAYAHSLAMTLGPIERTRAVIKKAIDVAAGVDDVELQAGLLYAQWSVEFMSSDHGAALASARQLTAVTPRGGDAMKLAGDRVLGTSLLYAGKLTDAQDHLQRVVDLYAAPSDGHNPLLFVYDPRVLARAQTGARAQPSRLPGPGLRGGSVQLRDGSIVRRGDHRVLGPARCVVSHRADAG